MFNVFWICDSSKFPWIVIDVIFYESDNAVNMFNVNMFYFSSPSICMAIWDTAPLVVGVEPDPQAQDTKPELQIPQISSPRPGRTKITGLRAIPTI